MRGTHGIIILSSKQTPTTMHTDRRTFIATMAATCAATALPRRVAAADGGEIRAMLLHLGHNMWCDWIPSDVDPGKCKAPKPDCDLRS